jgi:hypothetical protein
MRVFGDDFIISVARCIASFFNPKALEEDFKECGRTLTATDKGEICGWKNNLADCVFLKRSFNFGTVFPGMWSSTLPKSVVLDCAYYVRDPDYLKACEVNASQSLRMAFWHGEEYFNILRSKFTEVLSQYKSVYLPTYRACYGEFYRKYYDEPTRKFYDESDHPSNAAAQDGQMEE